MAEHHLGQPELRCPRAGVSAIHPPSLSLLLTCPPPLYPFLLRKPPFHLYPSLPPQSCPAIRCPFPCVELCSDHQQGGGRTPPQAGWVPLSGGHRRTHHYRPVPDALTSCLCRRFTCALVRLVCPVGICCVPQPSGCRCLSCFVDA